MGSAAQKRAAPPLHLQARESAIDQTREREQDPDDIPRRRRPDAEAPSARAPHRFGMDDNTFRLLDSIWRTTRGLLIAAAVVVVWYMLILTGQATSAAAC
jgi:hypothetical protein